MFQIRLFDCVTRRELHLFGLDGYFAAYAVAAKQDEDVGGPGEDRRNQNINREGEINFKASTLLSF